MIALIRINSTETMANPPLGLLYVGGALKKAGYEVKVFHICENNVSKHIDEIIALKPLWVGFSVNTGWSIKSALFMSREIKKKIPTPIVWGNAHPSLLPEQCLKEEAVDFVVIGEGEISAVELSTAIESDKELSSIRGIGFKNRNGNIIINPARELIDDLDQYEMDWSLLDPERYVFAAPQFGMKRAFQYITSRGCPHSCSFCFNQRFNKGKWRSHSEEFVVEKVLDLKDKLNLDGIRFWDDNFFTNKKRAFSILNKISLPYTSEIRVDYFDEAFAKKLNDSKCKMVLLGLESGSNRVLKLINKNTSRDTNCKALKILSRYPDISIHPSVIVGFPSETEDEYRETLDMFAGMIMKKPNFWFIRLGLYVPYPGCELYDFAVKECGMQPPALVEEWDELCFDTSQSKSVICVDWLKDKDDLKLDESYLIMLNRMVKSSFPYGFLCGLVYKRIKNRYYKFQIEKTVYTIVSGCIGFFRNYFMASSKDQ